jgi:hypothetical protein
MAKSKKKIYKYLIIIVSVIILVPGILFYTIRFPRVQTFIIKMITRHISQEIKSTVSIGKAELIFFNKIALYELLIKDRNNDTLLYTPKLAAGIRKIDFKNSAFRFGKVEMIMPVIALITDTTGSMNLIWYIEHLKKSSDTTLKKESYISINQIDLNNSRFSLINRTKSAGKNTIDFNDLHLSNLNAIIENVNIGNGNTSFSIYNLGFKESSGFVVKKLSSDMIINKQNIIFNSVNLSCNNSMIKSDHLALLPDTAGSFKRFTEEVRLDIILDKSHISSPDLGYFMKVPEGLNESIRLSGIFSGTVSELRGRDVEISYADSTFLSCAFDFSGLPDIANTFIYIGIKSFKTASGDIEKFRIPRKGNIVLPEALHKLGDITFYGNFTGFTTDFVAYGKLTSSLGDLNTDISFRPEKSDQFRINGFLRGSNISLGKLSAKPDLLGNLSFEANVDGYASSFKSFSADLAARVDSVEINKYKYRNINLDGIANEKAWDGSIKIKDENIQMDILGLFDFRKELPEFDFTLNLVKANLFNLNIDKEDKNSSLSMLLTTNLKGNSIDNMDGELRILNLNVKRNNENLELFDLSLKGYDEEGVPVIRLRTDFADADLKGHYNFSELKGAVKTTLASLMPSGFKASVSPEELKQNDFTLKINFKNTDDINNFFKTGLQLAEKSYINIDFSPASLISLNCKSQRFSFKKNVFNDLTIDATTNGTVLSTALRSSSLMLLGFSELSEFKADLSTMTDKFNFLLNWDNKEKILNKGNFQVNGSIVKKDNETDNSILRMDIEPSEIYTRGNIWKVYPAVIKVDTNAVEIERFFIGNNENFYKIDGKVSEDPSDTLHFEFKGIDISQLGNNEASRNTGDQDKIPLMLMGNLNGKLLITDIYRNIMLESDLKLNDFSMLGSRYGNITIESVWDKRLKVVNVLFSNDLNGTSMFNVNGYYDPETKRSNLNIHTSQLPVDALNPLLKSFASGIRGFASGDLNLTGELKKLTLDGALMVDKASVNIDYLRTKYFFNDTIRFDRSGFIFKNIKLTDEKGNGASLNGIVYHNFFRDYAANLTITTNESMVLNTRPKDNELFYGTAFATGVTTIKTGNNILSFDISAATGRNTRFFIPLNSGLSVSDYSFVTFVDSSGSSKTIPSATAILPAVKKDSDIDLNFDLEVTPDAEVQLIMDSKAGDVMKGHGSGNLNISLKKGVFKISGDYIIEEGDYLFTLGNLLNKRFTVENGGKITFNGDITDADIDLRAIYRLRTSLYEILGDESFNERIPVECQLNLSGKLFNPVVQFNIILPTADEKTRTLVRNYITTEEELSRQFLYLLVMNSFYSDPSSATGTTATSGTSAMGVTTTEMLSNQLSNWLSQISNDFDIGFVYRPGNKDINTQEVEVALSTQLLNDKVTINGNFDVRGTGTSGSAALPGNNYPITGDFDVEYKITEKIRFKVFNRFNNPYTGKGVPYTQGIGLFYKQDFDKLQDLFRKKEKSDMRREEETNPAINQ